MGRVKIKIEANISVTPKFDLNAKTGKKEINIKKLLWLKDI